MRESFPPITINFAPVKVVGIPGLSLVAIVIALVVQFPEAQSLLFWGVSGGAGIAALLILARSRREYSGSAGEPPSRPVGPLGIDADRSSAERAARRASRGSWVVDSWHAIYH
jgi:hypothetical protein